MDTHRQGSDKAVPRPTERPFIFLIIIVFDLLDELFVASLEQRRVKNKLDNDSGDRHDVTIGEPANESTTRKQSEPNRHESHVDQYPSHCYERWLDHRYQREVSSKDWMDTETIVAAAMSSESFSP